MTDRPPRWKRRDPDDPTRKAQDDLRAALDDFQHAATEAIRRDWKWYLLVFVVVWLAAVIVEVWR